jgi:hypothetical protein
MASTRDINSSANYCLEQRAQLIIRNNNGFNNGPNGRAFDPAFPELYRQGYMPPDNFSFNPTDIESSLLGIGSTNLEETKAPVVPRFKQLDTVSFFKTPDVIQAKTITPLLNQRPFICRM